MRVAVFGLGYVGSVMTGCLARAGHEVVGVDLRPEKVEAIAAGASPVVERGLDELIAAGHAAGLVGATADPAAALAGAALSFVCVGTPAAPDGAVDTAAVEAVCGQIGAVLRGLEQPRHTVVLRSTVMPGTAARCAAALARETGAPAGERFALCLNPEFLREGSAVADFLAPPFTVVGAADPAWAEPLRELYAFVAAPFVVTEPGVAELLKVVCNAWHATKVCFGNEVGRLCAANGVDALALMDLFVRDERLNVSPCYLRPGFAYGGSCLPKDVGAAIHVGRRSQLSLPLLEAVPRSNALQVELAKSRILATGCRRVGFLGLSFKPGTDDLRGSPLVDLVEFCLGKGLSVRIYDPGVRPARLVGRNLQVALERLGHLADLLGPDAAALAAESDLVILGHRDRAMADLCRGLPASTRVLDLVGALAPPDLGPGREGLCW